MSWWTHVSHSKERSSLYEACPCYGWLQVLNCGRTNLQNELTATGRMRCCWRLGCALWKWLGWFGFLSIGRCAHWPLAKHRNADTPPKHGDPAKNSSYDTHLYKLCEEAKVKRFCMHALRHTYAIRAIARGVQSQQLLGHKSFKQQWTDTSMLRMTLWSMLSANSSPPVRFLIGAAVKNWCGEGSQKPGNHWK